MPEGPLEPAYFTVETLAAYLDLPVRTIRKWAMARRLPGMVRAGKLWRFRRADIERAALSGTLLLPKPAPVQAWRMAG
jgi:excisionase family DNA binding protein